MGVKKDVMQAEVTLNNLCCACSSSTEWIIELVKKGALDLFGHDPMIQAIAGLTYGLLVAYLLYWSIKRGMHLTGFSFKDLMTTANDDLTIKYFDC